MTPQNRSTFGRYLEAKGRVKMMLTEAQIQNSKGNLKGAVTMLELAVRDLLFLTNTLADKVYFKGKATRRIK